MKPKNILPLLGICFIWGFYYVASQQTVHHMSVFNTGIVIRFLTMILLIILMGGKGQLKELTQVGHTLPRLLLIGVLGFSLDLTAFIGLSISAAGTGTALLKCDILFVNLISALIYKKRFSGKEWLFTVVMLFGVFLVVGVDFTNFRLDKGSIFFILSALFVSINAFVIKSVQLDQENPQSDNTVAFYNNFVTMVLFTITSCFMGTIGELGQMTSNKTLLLWSVLAGLGQTGIYIVYYYDLRHFPVWVVKTFLLLMPIVAALFAFLFFGQTMEVSKMIGVAVVLLGGLGMLLGERENIHNGSVMEGR